MRHLLIAVALVVGALLVTATIAGYLESIARRPTASTYTPPVAPPVGRAVPTEQGRSLLNVGWRRLNQ